jgi:hypothetical protein
VEPGREQIEDLMRRYGYEEKEAETAYHLGEAQARIFEMYRAEAQAEAEAGTGGFPTLYAEMSLRSDIIPHFEALGSVLAKRVLARQFPEGWGYRPAPEQEEQPD